MDARTGSAWLTNLRVAGVIEPLDVIEAIMIASRKSPSRAIKDGQAYAYRNRKGDQMQQLTFGKAVRWLAMLRCEEGDEMFAIRALELALENGCLIDGWVVPHLPKGKVKAAAQFAIEKHGMQLRSGGELHYLHVLRVAVAVAEDYRSRGRPVDEIVQGFCEGALHDVIEDTEAAEAELRSQFGDAVTETVLAVTHESEDEPDKVYMAKVKAGGERAIIVKRYDKLDNIACLAKADAEFRREKIAENRAALPLWQAMDPEGAVLIERALECYE